MNTDGIFMRGSYLIKTVAICFFLIIMAMFSCNNSSTEPDPELEPGGSDYYYIPVIFPGDKNAALGKTYRPLIVNGIYTFVFPEGTKLTGLVPEIYIPDNDRYKGSVIYINDSIYEPDTAYDFSGNVQFIKIVAEDGKQIGNYRICIKTGDSYIDDKVYKFMNDFSIPEVSLSIMRGTEIVYSSGYGFADNETYTRCTSDHLFRVGNISMQFCTMCIMTLKEEGRLRLDDKVFGSDGILKGLYHDVTSYHDSITVRHLLSHSSGLSVPSFNSSYLYYENTSIPVPTDTLIQRTLMNRQQPYDDGNMVWNAGAGYDFSNIGFCILQRIVEVISGKDYESFLKEDVLSKMGIRDTHIGGDMSERRANECRYYSQNDVDVYSYPLRELAGAIGIITSTNQMMRILSFMDGDDTVPDIFSSETLQEMYTPFLYSGAGSYGKGYNKCGLGWSINNDMFNGSHYSDGGKMDGTAALWVGCTNSEMSGAIICNTRAYNSNYQGDIDDNMYLLLNSFLSYFE